MEKVKTFQVKEVCNICKVTRKALLIYEGKGLLTPYYINKDSGYRYYNAENISKIMHIRKFQSFGFSLDEISEYLDDTKELSVVYDRLNKIKEELDATIEQLKQRMMTAEYNKQEIVRIVLPRCYCYAENSVTHCFEEALNFLRETHLHAIVTDRSDKTAKMYNSVLSFEGEYPDIYGTCEMRYCIPMDEGYAGKNAMVEEKTSALSLFHRGPYTMLIDSIKTIMDYCKTNNVRQTGPMRLIWLEGPPVHGANEEKYLTQIAVPIEE